MGKIAGDATGPPHESGKAGTPTGEPLVLWLIDFLYQNPSIAYPPQFFIQATTIWFQILDNTHKNDIRMNAYVCVDCSLYTQIKTQLNTL